MGNPLDPEEEVAIVNGDDWLTELLQEEKLRPSVSTAYRKGITDGILAANQYLKGKVGSPVQFAEKVLAGRDEYWERIVADMKEEIARQRKLRHMAQDHASHLMDLKGVPSYYWQMKMTEREFEGMQSEIEELKALLAKQFECLSSIKISHPYLVPDDLVWIGEEQEVE
jgi:hypothetical protein